MGALVEIEARVPPEVRAVQERSFAALLRKVLRDNRFYQKKYEALGFTRARPVGVSDRARLPFTLRAELVADQKASAPYGSNLSCVLAQYTRVHQSSEGAGPCLAWLDTAESWSWSIERWAEALAAAGTGAEDRVLVSGPFGQEINSWAAVEAGQRLGAMVVSGGGLDPEDQVSIMSEHRVGVLVATPGGALALAEVAAAKKLPVEKDSLRIVLHNEGAQLPRTETVAEVASAWGARCFRVAGSTEIGIWGFGCGEPGRLHVNEAEFFVEVIDPKSGEAAPFKGKGYQRGQLVLTNLGRLGSPLIRYLTGLRVRLVRRPCSCGRSTTVLVDRH